MKENVTITFAFLGGLLSFASPCVLPLIPSYISFVTGISFEELTEKRGENKLKKVIFLNSLLFIAGFSLVFVSLGASASFMGQAILTYQEIIRKIGGVIIILLGIHIIGIINFSILQRDKRLHFFHQRPAGMFGSFLVGIGFAAGWTPCIGPILATILIVAASSKTIGLGVILLVAYSMGLAIPFIVTSLGINTFLKYFNRFKRYMRIVSVITGSFLILTGVLIYTNYFAILTGYLNNLIPLSGKVG